MPTPLMEQYLGLKAKHPQALLFFRCGDFYELFYEDARTASEALGIALTTRSKEEGIPMAGVPHHAAQGYVRRLLESGHRVAIAEQLTDPKDSPGLIVRDVTEVVTPGTVTEWSMLEERRALHLLAVAPGRLTRPRKRVLAKAAVAGGSVALGEPAPGVTDADDVPGREDDALAEPALDPERTIGLAWLEVASGRFLCEEAPLRALEEEIARIDPAEVLVPDGAAGDLLRRGPLKGRIVTPFPALHFEEENGARALRERFQAATLEGFGIGPGDRGAGAAGALLAYVAQTKKDHLAAITGIERFRREGTLLLDPATRRALELVETSRTRERRGSLLHAIDRTATAMGARRLREWLEAPLLARAEIELRLDAVGALEKDARALEQTGAALADIQDLERLAGRIAAGRAGPRDLVGLATSLAKIPALRDALPGGPGGVASPEGLAGLLAALARALDPHADLGGEIARTLVPGPPLSAKEGGLVREGVDPELDRLRSLAREGKDWLARYQEEEAQRTGIPSLKVGHHNVFGYFIEVTNAHAQKVPGHYARKQTLKNAERYVTPELKEYETQVVSAKERGDALEERLFKALRAKAEARAEGIRTLARAVASLDALRSLAQLAKERRYRRPTIVDDPRLLLTEARHPVLEQTLSGEPFVPNDLTLDAARRIAVVTGPNMAGKSTFCRQTALVVLLAQMGGFVPAKSAEIGLCDRIFARIGAADELARGLSTFMVEMTETANILRHASERSLVILDEVGRGTSTFDGVSLAFAITEHLSEVTRARTLFATHYHELTELAETDPRVVNLSVAVREWGDEIVFLRKIVEGAADRSYGLHVARLAGVPRKVIERAKEVLESLERLALDGAGRPRLTKKSSPAERKPRPRQLGLFAAEEEKIALELRTLRLEELTPMRALRLLEEWQGRLQAGG